VPYRRLLLLAVLLPLMASSAADAHELGISRLEVAWEDDGSLSLQAELPVAVEATLPRLPSGCDLLDTSRRAGRTGQVRHAWRFACSDLIAVTGGKILFDWAVEGVFVALRQDDDGVVGGYFFDREDGPITVELADVLGADQAGDVDWWRYFFLGVEHILSGWDHLAFVLALCLVAQGMRLVRLVTAFTLGHSLTLLLGTAGWVQVPAAPLEASIALSIAFVAREAMHGRGHSFLVVLAFGLLHGLGFASALNEASFVTGHLVRALFGFNLGVEVGQLVFVAAVILLATVTRPLTLPAVARPAVAFSVGTIGIFWTVERTLGMLP
jgi:hydrogenase/urease accessory protein HupE